MRGIKFRAFHKETKTMINIQNMLSFSNDGSIWINENKQYPENTFSGWIGIDFELMQYTGLFDKQGVEIYEDDVIDYDGEIVKVTYENIMASFCVGGNNFDSSEAKYMKIIGNFYENPELLEEKE